MESEAKILLADVAAYLQRDGGDARLVQMLLQSDGRELTEDTLTVTAPSRFAIAYLERNRALIEEYLEQIAFAPIAIEILSPTDVVLPETARPAGSAAGAPVAPVGTPGPAVPTPAPAVIPAAPAAAEPREAGSIRVKNTLSKHELREMMGRMGTTAAAPSTAGAAPATPQEPAIEPEVFPQTPISSKFTFATFVFGDENKHAYYSAQRFAAFADEPGQSNSLFIYGGSGLGKTHLLLAIKNYLAENKPHIRVKYANSQAYIDDFISEIASQKTESRAILREYHDANILIIDDIQNIIGKQASIEYFFSLIDEFIRENKKVVIASDRAPKKLGMDERLTSRFNAGMLCLVSEPGFEMKYTILKRYYETIICGGEGAAEMNVDATLLGAFQSHEGRLTDEQLRHMAEISGNNIRELESFCERCASLSYEREQAGGELDAADIEKVADEYFDTAHKVIHIDTIQDVVEEFYHVSHEDLIGPKRSRDIAFARHVAVYLANSLCDLSATAVGEQFGGRDHSTVINSLKVVEKKIKEDRRICEDLQQLKNKITLRS
ncbi:MAG: DnaA/Hda family protein [Collinsella sp.]|nr:DnaA/Hda family protein [Collinsella sp.]